MGAGKNKRHRKKRISKHVVESQTRKKQEDAEKQLLAASEGDGETSTPVDDATPNESKKSTKNIKTKDPAEAASYLALWNLDRNSDSTTKNWKFNKNTSSWLLRHMYDPDKVSKTTFATLVDYVCEGGEKTILRVKEEAKRRARRYKEWEKKHQKDGDTNQNDAADETKDAISSSPDDETWNQLDDHDKRKEYKRARKVLDSIKKQ